MEILKISSKNIESVFDKIIQFSFCVYTHLDSHNEAIYIQNNVSQCAITYLIKDDSIGASECTSKEYYMKTLMLEKDYKGQEEYLFHNTYLQIFWGLTHFLQVLNYNLTDNQKKRIIYKMYQIDSWLFNLGYKRRNGLTSFIRKVKNNWKIT